MTANWKPPIGESHILRTHAHYSFSDVRKRTDETVRQIGLCCCGQIRSKSLRLPFCLPECKRENYYPSSNNYVRRALQHTTFPSRARAHSRRISNQYYPELLHSAANRTPVFPASRNEFIYHGFIAHDIRNRLPKSFFSVARNATARMRTFPEYVGGFE